MQSGVSKQARENKFIKKMYSCFAYEKTISKKPAEEYEMKSEREKSTFHKTLIKIEAHTHTQISALVYVLNLNKFEPTAEKSLWKSKIKKQTHGELISHIVANEKRSNVYTGRIH